MVPTTSLLHAKLLQRMPVAVLTSPLHRMLRHRVLLLRFTGRRTGRRYATPISFTRRGSDLLLTTDSRWWRNLDGGAAVEVVLRGRRHIGHARAVHGAAAVDVLDTLIRDHPPYRRWAHVRLRPDGSPDPDDVRAEIARGRVGIVVTVDAP